MPELEQTDSTPEPTQPEPLQQQGFLPPPQAFQQVPSPLGEPTWSPAPHQWGQPQPPQQSYPPQQPYQSYPQRPYQSYPQFQAPPTSPYQYPYATQGTLPPSPKRTNIGLVIAIVVVAALLCCCCFFAALAAFSPSTSMIQDYYEEPSSGFEDSIEGQIF